MIDREAGVGADVGDRLERVEIMSAAELRAWLARHHERSDGVWLVTYKRHRADRWVRRDDILDELVAHGWTDGAMRKIDDDRVMQLISRRRTHIWARSYRKRADRLIEQGRMHPSGLAAIEHARQLGTWDEHDHVDDLVVPTDLAAELAARANAVDHFEAFPPSHRRNVLRWLAKAKKPDTRTRRIAEIAEHAAARQRLPGL